MTDNIIDCIYDNFPQENFGCHKLINKYHQLVLKFEDHHHILEMGGWEDVMN